jgi:TRAP-type C4-dicarboxylate transport system substrate-binding protein
MNKAAARLVAIALALSWFTQPSGADPAKLKFAYFSSDRTTTYLAAIKPFVDAVNSDAAGLIEIEVVAGGALGKNPTEQLQLVLDGKADIAFIVPGYTAERFVDNRVVELPGLFDGIREATLVYTRLIAANALRGYDDLFVAGAFATEPESIHARVPIASLADLQGKRIRTNNPVQATALEQLGMIAVPIPVNKIAAAISAGEIDGAAVAPATLIEFGIARVAANHYLLGVSSAPLAVVMNRKTFEGLPGEGQDVIRRYSGEWLAERYISFSEAENKLAIDSLKSEPNRKVVLPSEADRERVEEVFEDAIEEWRTADPRHGDLLATVETELSTLRSGQ